MVGGCRQRAVVPGRGRTHDTRVAGRRGPRPGLRAGRPAGRGPRSRSTQSDGSRRRPRPAARPARPTGGLRWSSSGSEGRATASSRPRSRSAQSDGSRRRPRPGARPARPTGGSLLVEQRERGTSDRVVETPGAGSRASFGVSTTASPRGSACSTNGRDRWSSSGSEGRATVLSRPPQLHGLGPGAIRGLDDGLAQGLGLLDQREGGSLLVEQRERGTSDRVVETSVTDTLIVGVVVLPKARWCRPPPAPLKGSLRRFAPLTAPAPAGVGAYRDDADLWSA